MANEEHVRILKSGVKKWKTWRQENPQLVPDLSHADLRGADLRNVDLNTINMRSADLRTADLCGAGLIETNLHKADLRGTDLSHADLSTAILINAKLNGADLSGADLTNANLRGAIFEQTSVFNMYCFGTVFSSLSLEFVTGLETVIHRGPSSFDLNVYFESNGNIPEVFLRGVGLSDIVIEYLPYMAPKAIEFYSCFISYSHADKSFAQLLYDTLQGQGIRCWFDEHQLKPGDRLHPTIYQAIRTYDKVLLCCSETALKSWWVEKEFERMMRKEEDYNEVLLIPVNIDGYLFGEQCEGWIADEIKQRFVANMTKWKEHDAFEVAVRSLIKALKTDGGNLPPPIPKLKPKQ
ncbi:MAG: toll/interleukin-1 receptor domain-containing protein [Anaerolineae bacterium]|nr:toll/interleukin-1 receptor domain-containing protein [Anaerolineae bacterium]